MIRLVKVYAEIKEGLSSWNCSKDCPYLNICEHCKFCDLFWVRLHWLSNTKSAEYFRPGAIRFEMCKKSELPKEEVKLFNCLYKDEKEFQVVKINMNCFSYYPCIDCIKFIDENFEND